MTVSEEAALTQTLALLPPPLIFGRVPKCFNTTVWTSLSSGSESKITHTYAILFYSFMLFVVYFMLCYIFHPKVSASLAIMTFLKLGIDCK